ncbi:MAG: hypothetical protein ACOY0T_16970 [Myxococcota bacterium]
MKRPLWSARLASLALVCCVGRSAVAETLPSHFVSSDQCMSRECTCADGPMMEVFLQNQQNARNAWISVRSEIFTATGPQSMDDAVKLFYKRFPGDSRVNAQFMTCNGYDPNVNTLNKIAGTASVGNAALDPCFCDAFCKGIIDATVDHELTHGPTLLAGFAGMLQYKVVCKTGVLPDSFCNALDPAILADSEIISYTVGNHTLSNAIEELRDRDPQNPQMACTWEPLPAASTNQLPPVQPSGFWDRVKMLADRFLYGNAP